MRNFKTFKWNHQESNSKPMKMTEEQQDSLFGYLERRLGKHSCDHSLKFTLEWARLHRLDSEEMVKYLHRNGGYCDCEVVFNVLLR